VPVNKERIFRVLLIVTLVHGTTSCQTVKSQELTGTWVISMTSRQRFLSAEQQNIAGTIILNADGNFVAEELPKDLLYRKPIGGLSVSGSGVWKLIDDGGVQRILLEFRAITEGQQDTLPFGTLLNVSSGFSRTTLNYFQGDADLGRRVDFEKK
jgi:hypothetical protein